MPLRAINKPNSDIGRLRLDMGLRRLMTHLWGEMFPVQAEASTSAGTIGSVLPKVMRREVA